MESDYSFWSTLIVEHNRFCLPVHHPHSQTFSELMPIVRYSFSVPLDMEISPAVYLH
jgi:hypothetical protein